MTPGQERLVRIAIIIVAAAAAVFGFGMGFLQLPRADLAPKYGVICGIGSAVAWAVWSTFGNSFLGLGQPANRGVTLNNWFNLFAAAFAALSLGCLTPATAICDGMVGNAGGPAASTSFAFASLCRLRPPVAIVSNVTDGEIDRDSEKQRLDALGREWERRYERAVQFMLEHQAVNDQRLTELEKRVGQREHAPAGTRNPAGQ